ncbi:MAG: serpin family protein, partial [Planctomycetota bacterium]
EHTKDAPFSVSPANRITVPTMRQTERFGYAEAEGLQVLELPYVGDELSMAILLPKKTHGLAEIEALLDAGSMKTWLSRLAKRKVQVFLPRFKIEFGLDLKKALKSMGMPLAFDDRKADFSGMDGRIWLYIGAVIHQAYVDVNEEGTEAAAATAVVMKGRSVAKAPPVFRADHPFIFLIRDRKTGSILFVGRVMNPTG